MALILDPTVRRHLLLFPSMNFACLVNGTNAEASPSDNTLINFSKTRHSLTDWSRSQTLTSRPASAASPTSFFFFFWSLGRHPPRAIVRTLSTQIPHLFIFLVFLHKNRNLDVRRYHVLESSLAADGFDLGSRWAELNAVRACVPALSRWGRV